MTTEYTAERDTPASFNLSYDDERVPQRELTNFTVTAGDDRISICSLDDSSRTKADVIARGTVLANGNSLKIKSAPLIEWCIEYGSGNGINGPNLWVRSADVWYRLKKPSKEYARTHELARRRFELCSRIFILGTSMPFENCTYDIIVHLLSGGYSTMKGYSEKEILSEKDFILVQLKNLEEHNLSNLPFVKELREKKVPSSKKSSSKRGSSSSANASSGGSGSYPGPWVPTGKLDSEGNARLLKRTEKFVHQLYKHKNGWPFREPVNPEKDGVPDYFERIKTPMDFRTIKERFEKGQYTNSLGVAKDIRLIASNCREYNGDDHNFALWATELERKFENLMRGGEDAEVVAMNKRVASSKKRKASDQLPPSGKGIGKKSAPKVSRKSSKSSSAEASPSRDSSVKDDESLSRKQCARSSPQGCEKVQVAGSKYCSDECGLLVARKRIAELNKAGYSVEEYIKASMTKALVHSRS